MKLEYLKKQYTKFYDIESVNDNIISKIENTLEVKLPSDFKSIAKFYSGGLLGGISHHEISLKSSADNIC